MILRIHESKVFVTIVQCDENDWGLGFIEAHFAWDMFWIFLANNCSE